MKLANRPDGRGNSMKRFDRLIVGLGAGLLLVSAYEADLQHGLFWIVLGGLMVYLGVNGDRL